MGNNHENFEMNKAVDSVQEGKISNLSAYTMERSAPIQAGRDKNDSLVEKGLLPSISFMEMSTDVQTGSPATASDIRDAGVKIQHGKDGKTTGEYPSGVKIESSGISHSEKGPNIQIETSMNVVEAAPPNHLNKHGDVIDPKGRTIAKANEDGSVTVDSGKGFFKQHADGSITKESAIRSRDGKTFEVLDTNNPLGDMRPSDMTDHKHKH
jgi:hypothetical protein